jgi:hypothetical protein
MKNEEENGVKKVCKSLILGGRKNKFSNRDRKSMPDMERPGATG